ncbi:SPW repeat protein [Streptomyces sp. RB6PN25]|uniref:SPW repeat protein n=1 Tax=Streptomyces humicola TaxID=2953240 RepID=A0ABT1PVF1_9ACTN|nr:SPW repeat protein [Streptomyces humicola]MCQ4081627.1 SPW repeat protein [Streptomyces humicola]
MADLSHRPGDITAHPDVHEMRERYARMLGGRAVAVDGLLLLAGLYAAVSPWTVHFSTLRTPLAINNVITGLAVAAFGVGLAIAAERLLGLSWAVSAIGVWLIISPWVVTRSPDTGIMATQIATGAVICVLGLAGAAMGMRSSKARPV